MSAASGGAAHTWHHVTFEAPFAPRDGAGALVFKDRMWILGADAQNGRHQNDVWSSADGVRWERIWAEVPWKDRVLHHTVVHDGRIWVMGGQTMGKCVASSDAFHSDVWSTRDGADWRRETTAAPWSPRGMIGGSAVFRGRMWLLGGGTYDTPATPTRRFFNDVRSSPEGVRWTRHLEHAAWPPRQYHDVAVYDDRLWVMEG
jgi:hypothetical protein